MLVTIICPDCRHGGHVPDDMLPRSLKCSRCGGRARFERNGSLYAAAARPPRPSFTERARLPDDLLADLWRDQQ